MRESEIERYLVRRVKELGGEVRKVQWLGRQGAPDRFVMLPLNTRRGLIATNLNTPWAVRRSVWVELKAPGAKLRPSQARERVRMQAMGQWVVVVDSFEGVAELLS